jgi:hypothetical protein
VDIERGWCLWYDRSFFKELGERVSQQKLPTGEPLLAVFSLAIDNNEGSREGESNMANKIEVKAIDKSTIQIVLSKGTVVSPGKPVPIEALELILSLIKVQSSTEGGGDEEGCWGAGCSGFCVGH